MTALYFAYGSNLCAARMRERVPSSRPVGIARLEGHRWRCNKRGADGSGKANLEPDPGFHTWGALYRLDPAEWELLDACEAGYQRISVRVEDGAATLLEAVSYRSLRLTPDPTPFGWYRELILSGAREHGLPEDWVRTLAALRARN